VEYRLIPLLSRPKEETERLTVRRRVEHLLRTMADISARDGSGEAEGFKGSCKSKWLA
jgi:hypothetical protein